MKLLLSNLLSCSHRNLITTGSTPRISFELPYSDVLTHIGLLGRLNVSPCQDNKSQDSERTQKALAAKRSGPINISGTSRSSTESSPSTPSHSQTAEVLKNMQEYEIESPAKKRRK